MESDMLRPVDDIRVEALAGLTTAQKLIWLYMYSVGGTRFGIRHLALALELSTATVNSGLKVLVERGLVSEVERGSGNRPSRFRAETPKLADDDT